MRAILTLVTGLVLGLVAVFLIDRHITQIEEAQVSQPYLRLKTDQALSRGDAINQQMVEVVRLPEQFKMLKSIALPGTRDIGALITSGKAIAVRDISAGSFLLYEHITQTPEVSFSNMIGDGMRAFSISVTAISSVSYFVDPGSRVDILVTMQEKIPPAAQGQVSNSSEITPENIMQGMGAAQERLVTKTLMQNVLVMAVGNSVTSGSYLDSSSGYSTVTFEVTPVQAELLTFALAEAQGGLGLVLRNPGNKELLDIPAVSWDDLK